MTNLHQKLNTAAEHIRLTPAEKQAMRAALFGVPAQAGTASPIVVVRSPYVFASSHRMMVALASLVLVVFAGGGTAFAAQGALPGSPLYALKVHVVEPAQVALAAGPAQKAAVNAQIAQTRVEEAEMLAERGALDATTTQELALNFEAHAASAEALADQASSTDPAAAVQVRAQLGASAAAGGEVLAALGGQSNDVETKVNAAALSVRVLARAPRQNDEHGSSAIALAAKVAVGAPSQETEDGHPTTAAVRPMAFAKATTTATLDAPVSNDAQAPEDQSPRAQAIAASLEQKAQSALDALRAQVAASSTLSATSTANIGISISAIESLMAKGAAALGAAQYGTATDDFTRALSKTLRLSALLSAQQKFDTHAVESLFSSGQEQGSDDSGAGTSGSSGLDSHL